MVQVHASYIQQIKFDAHVVCHRIFEASEANGL